MTTIPCHECGHAIPEGPRSGLAGGIARRGRGRALLPGLRRPARDRRLSPRVARALRVGRGRHAARRGAGEGAPILLLHGLTATRRYVVHGSRALERAGHRVISYDARGHGALVARRRAGDLHLRRAGGRRGRGARRLGRGARGARAGQSMGSATAVALALRAPGARLRPGRRHARAPRAARARTSTTGTRLADGLERGGPEGFLAALGPLDDGRALARDRAAPSSSSAWRATSTPTRWPTRCAASRARRPSTGWTRSPASRVPTLIVGSRDEADPDHPLAVAEEYAGRIPGARLVVEDEGESPLAWRGGALSREMLALAYRRS